MKYLIEVPDETGQAYYNIAPYTNKNDELYWTDGYEKGVEAGRNDAWEFVTKCLKMNGNDFYEIFDSCDVMCLTNLSYQEAKVKYNAWKKKKEEIRVGDEVTLYDNVKLVVVTIDHGTSVQGIDENGECYECIEIDELTKTGRHFPEVAELLKKMRKSDED